MLILALAVIALGAIFQAPLRWSAKKLHREIFPEQIPDGPVYDGMAKAPVDLATFVGQARRAWPKAGVSVVHAAAVDVATGLLLRSDVEVGSIVDGKFVPWSRSPWTASQKIREELRAMPSYLEESGRYVFRRKPAAPGLPTAAAVTRP